VPEPKVIVANIERRRQQQQLRAGKHGRVAVAGL